MGVPAGLPAAPGNRAARPPEPASLTSCFISLAFGRQVRVPKGLAGFCPGRPLAEDGEKRVFQCWKLDVGRELRNHPGNLPVSR